MKCRANGVVGLKSVASYATGISGPPAQDKDGNGFNPEPAKIKQDYETTRSRTLAKAP